MKTNMSVCVALCASLILFVGAGQVQAQFVETFESLNNGDEANFLNYWSGSSTADQPAELGGNRALVGENTSGTIDLASMGATPQAGTTQYDVILDAYFFSSTGNQWMQGLNAAGSRIYEIQWISGGSWNWRTFGATTSDSGTIGDLAGNVDGLRSAVVHIDPSAGTAEAIIRQTGQSDLSLGAFPYAVADMTGLAWGMGASGSTMLMDTVSIVVPEPSTMMLAGAGLFGLTLGWRRRRNR